MTLRRPLSDCAGFVTCVLPLPFAGPGDALERAVGADRRITQVEAETVC